MCYVAQTREAGPIAAQERQLRRRPLRDSSGDRRVVTMVFEAVGMISTEAVAAHVHVARLHGGRCVPSCCC